MFQRPIVIAANWKLNKLRDESVVFADALTSFMRDHHTEDETKNLKVIFAPPATSLQDVNARERYFGLFAQDISMHASGAYTGELSGSMLADAGADGTLVGHSERRLYHHEDDAVVAAKVRRALDDNLWCIACVGESLDERNAGNARAVVERQVGAVLDAVPTADEWRTLYLAYEPVWAIGTGEVATPDMAEEMHAAIRQLLCERLGDETGNKVSILYGGSVKGANAPELLSQPNIDGALVGGASLSVEDFMPILQAGIDASAATQPA